MGPHVPRSYSLGGPIQQGLDNPPHLLDDGLVGNSVGSPIRASPSWVVGARASARCSWNETSRCAPPPIRPTNPSRGRRYWRPRPSRSSSDVVVMPHFLRVVSEQDRRRPPEEHVDLSHRRRQCLPRSDQERNAGPSPVVDLEPEGGERLRVRPRTHAFLAGVALVLPPDVLGGSTSGSSRRTSRRRSAIDVLPPEGDSIVTRART